MAASAMTFSLIRFLRESYGQGPFERAYSLSCSIRRAPLQSSTASWLALLRQHTVAGPEAKVYSVPLCSTVFQDMSAFPRTQPLEAKAGIWTASANLKRCLVSTPCQTATGPQTSAITSGFFCGPSMFSLCPNHMHIFRPEQCEHTAVAMVFIKLRQALQMLQQ